MLKLPLYNNTKLRLAFEFGAILSDSAKELNVELTPEIMERAEKIVVNELRTRTASQFACDMNVLVLACFEVN